MNTKIRRKILFTLMGIFIASCIIIPILIVNTPVENSNKQVVLDTISTDTLNFTKQ